MLSMFAALSAHILLFHLTPSISATPLQLHLPTLVNSASLNSTSLSINNTTLLDDYYCFSPLPDRLPTTYNDCAAAALEMKTSTDTEVHTFGRGSSATYKLPKSFYSGTCVVTLDMAYDDQTDKLTLREIQDAAFTLALRCATGSVFNVGGIIAVGSKKVLHVTILGTVAPSTS